MTTVYVSATSMDLKEFRDVARRVIRRLGLRDVAMEEYRADPRPPLERCLEDVRACDLYVGIFAFRYGYEPTDGGGKSITHLEYLTAFAGDKPCFIFMIPENAAWPADVIDRDRKSIDLLRKDLTTKHLVDFFVTKRELDEKLTQALTRHLNDVPGSVDPGNTATRPAPRTGAWQAYYSRLRELYTAVELEPLTLDDAGESPGVALSSVFVEPFVHTDDHPELRTPLFDRLLDDDHRTTVLLADPGGGKSAVSRYLTLNLAATEHEPEPRLVPLRGHLPLLIELRSYARALAERQCTTFIEYLDYRARVDGLGLARADLTLYLDNGGQALAIFDGLDEVIDRAERDRVSQQIAGFAAAYPQVRVLVTARTVGYSRRILAGARFQYLTIEDFNEAQIAEFLDRWYQLVTKDPEVADGHHRRMMKAVRSSAPIRELAGNALLLSILAIIGHNEQLPEQRWQVYEHAANVLIEQWEKKRNPDSAAGGQTPPSADDKMQVLQKLAFQMQSQHEGQDSVYVDRATLSRMFEAHLVGRYHGTQPDLAYRWANDAIDQLQRNFILGERERGNFGFVHRTFLEFFCVQELVRQIEAPDSEWTTARLRNLFDQHWAEPSWREVLLLLAGRVDPDTAGELIGALATEVNRPWPADRFPEPPWNLALAAQCVAEQPDVALVAAAAEQVLRQIILLAEHGLAGDGQQNALVEGEILSAVRMVGSEWPGAQTYLTWYRRRGVMISWERSPFVTQIAMLLARPLDQMEEFVTAALGSVDNRRARLAIVAGLAEPALRAGPGAHNADKARWRGCRRLLERHATGDIESTVRLAALRALVDNVPLDPAFTQLLIDRTREDSDPEIRLLALTTLTSPRRLSDKVRQLLVNCAGDGAVQDKVRVAAVATLARYRDTHDDVRDLLDKIVRTDPSAEVVYEAARRLFDPLKSNQTLYPPLAQRIRSGAGSSIRRISVRLIGELFFDTHFGAAAARLLRVLVREDNDATVRKEALRALAVQDRRSPELHELMIEALGRDRSALNRLAAQHVLVQQFPRDEGRRTWTALAEQAENDPDQDVRQSIVRDLGTVGDDDATFAVILRLALQDISASVRLAATETLADWFPDRAETLQLILTASTEQNTRVRLAAVRILVTLQGSGEVNDALHARVRDETDPRIIREAATCLLAAPSSAARTIEALVARVRHGSSGVRLAVVESLIDSTIDETELRVLLCDVAEEDPDPDVFGRAITCIASRSTNDMNPIRILTNRSVNSRDPQIRAVALALLARHFGANEDVREHVMDRVRREDSELCRRAAVQMLGERYTRQRDVQNFLLELWDDPDWSVSSTAVHSLGAEIGSNPEIRQRLLRMIDPSEDRAAQHLGAQVLSGQPGLQLDLLPSIPHPRMPM